MVKPIYARFFLVFIGSIALSLQGHKAFGQFHNRPIYDTTTARGIRYRAEVSGQTSSTGRTPFWFSSDQFGTVPWDSPAGVISLGGKGIWGDAKQRKKPYLKASLEMVGNIGGTTRLLLAEGYASVILGHGELYVGRRKEINGLTDTLLTSGSIAWSGNAIPITQIRLGTRDFAPLKFTGGILSVNAFYSHGWFANTDSMQRVMLHAKSVFIRIGKPTWKFRLYGGINHFAQWGGYSQALTQGLPGLAQVLSKEGQLPNTWKAYKDVVWPIGQPSHDDQFSAIDTLNQVGNHLGSIDFAIDINFEHANLYAYYQHIYEDNSGLLFKNFPDGLFGLRWKNLKENKGTLVQVKQLTTEFITTINRSGTDPIYGGDDYFFNSQYLDGWTHKQHVIGTPIFTRTYDIPDAVRKNNPWFSRNPNRYRPVNNNAVQAVHVGLYALVANKIPIVMMVTANKYYEWPDIKKNYNQLYSSLEINNINISSLDNLKVGLKAAYDTGEIFTQNFGAMLKLVKYY